jgi:hypothetical protein
MVSSFMNQSQGAERGRGLIQGLIEHSNKSGSNRVQYVRRVYVNGDQEPARPGQRQSLAPTDLNKLNAYRCEVKQACQERDN